MLKYLGWDNFIACETYCLVPVYCVVMLFLPPLIGCFSQSSITVSHSVPFFSLESLYQKFVPNLAVMESQVNVLNKFCMCW